MLLCDTYLVPDSLDEALAAMETHRGEHRLVAGSTDILPWAREGRAGDVTIPTLIDVTRIPELRECRTDGGRVRIGAATPIQRFLDDAALLRALPCMPHCAVWFADDQIRESATVGGNIINASPAADMTPPLLAHNAQVELAALRQGRVVRRKLALADFVIGPSQTRREEDEILVSIDCDALPGYGGSFEKVGHRRSLVISVVCLAALVKLDASGRHFEDVRIAIGGVGPVPRRLDDIEAALRGTAVDAGRIQGAAEMTPSLVQSRTRQEYRREVLAAFVIRGLMNAVRRAGGAPGAVPELEASYA